MEDDLTVQNFIAKSMSRLKHLIVTIAFGAPMFQLCLLLFLRVNYKRNKCSQIRKCTHNSWKINHFVYSHCIGSTLAQVWFHFNWFGVPSYPLQVFFLWFKIEENERIKFIICYFELIFPVFVLIITEAYGTKIKMYKYFHCITFVIYESICIVSIFICAYTVLTSSYIELRLKRWQEMTPSEIRFYASIFIILNVIASGTIIFSHWIKNTIVHISVIRSKLFQVSRSSMRKHIIAYVCIELMHSISCLCPFTV